jgi:photosystem II stability/assembly factor-like uncharacterized protein
MKTKPRISMCPAIIAGFVVLSAIAGGIVFLISKDTKNSGKRIKYESFLVSLNKNAPQVRKHEKIDKPAADEPGMAAFHDFLMTFDPETGTMPRERLIAALEQTRSLSASKQNSTIQWQGIPCDMGGRTRAIMYDPNDPNQKTVWAGGITGGLWVNTNITDAASPWSPVDDFGSNMAIRCMAYDPGHPQTFFVGTGEVETAMQTYRESSGLGFGICRSDDGGKTWNRISGTEQFAYVTDIVIRIERDTSVIYAGVASGLYKGSQHPSMPSDGLFRSKDNGATWHQVMPVITGSTVPYCVSDIALGADNRLYVGTRPNLDGEGAAVLLYSDDGTHWIVNNQYQTEIKGSSTNNIPGRVILDAAPSDPNVVDALIASGYINAADGFNYFNCYHILRSSDKGVTWIKKNLPADLTSGNNFATIAWHALDLAIDPNDANVLYIGGLDIHKSYNGGSYWIRESDWTKMYFGGGPQYIHGDQHAIVFKPGSSDEVLFGTDGGIFYTSNGTGISPTFEEHNKGYSTLQFYTCAIHPYPGIEQYYGGLQDNGTLFYIGNPFTVNDMVSGGDGAYCFFNDYFPEKSITSIYYNNYYVFDNANFQNSINNWTSGTFISPADLDNNLEILYCNAVDYIGTHQDQILRLEDLTSNTSGTFLNLNTGSTVFFSALKWSPYSPVDKSTLFVGSESGRLFKVQEAQATPQVTEIGSAGFPAANISSIAIGKSEDTLIVTFSNYGVASVWQTYNGGQTWQDVEGNLPDMPVRWALFHPVHNRQALIATETGVWECIDLQQSPAEWQPVNTGMANVRVDMLQLRKRDNTVLAATHGRGLFTMTWFKSTGIPEQTEDVARVYPNPSGGSISISAMVHAGSIQITVFDVHGREVYREQKIAVKRKFNAQINLENQPKGTYFIAIKNENRKFIAQKIIIQ